MLIANYKGLRRNDSVALTLARRWSHAAGLTFAVGAVSGTVLSFEMGLLWPGLTGKYGDVFGLPFAIEGIAFFLEAILVAIYIYGWRRLPGWTHFWLGVPIPFVALVGAFSIISANAWMNTPAGFTIGPDGTPTNVDPIGAIFNKALPYEFIHFMLAAYMAAGFTVASIYVVGWLRGRRDRYHRLGILIPFTVAAIVTPLQFAVGDTMARWVANNQPAKFSAMEVVTESGTDQPEIIFGRYDEATNTVSGGIRIPGLNSFLTGGSRDTYVQGLDAVPLENRPSNVNIVHWAFDIMVGIGIAAHPPGGVVRHRVLAPTGTFRDPRSSSGSAALAGCPHLHRDRGGLDRHRGRPAAVDRVQHRTYLGCGHSVRRRLGELHDRRRALRRPGCRHHRRPAGDVATLAAAGPGGRGSALWATARARARSEPGPGAVRRGTIRRGAIRLGAGRRRRRTGGHMTAADAVAGILVLGVTLYAWSGLADFGAGFWDLVAGGREGGRRPRALIDAVITPVWEANHVWLIFLLVVCWTAFGSTFASIMTTMWVPMALAVLGIVLRGANFALRKDAARAGTRHLAGWLFGLGALLTPFFLGTAIGGLLTARVPPGNNAGDELTSWWNATSIVVGLLAIATGAFLAAVYLISEARRRDLPDLKAYFAVRAVIAGIVGLLLGAAALATLYADETADVRPDRRPELALLALGALALDGDLRPRGPGSGPRTSGGGRAGGGRTGVGVGCRAVSLPAAVRPHDLGGCGRGPDTALGSRLVRRRAAHRGSRDRAALRPRPAG